jgi:Concanavalin A-like lectin/glucanases superfamily
MLSGRGLVCVVGIAALAVSVSGGCSPPEDAAKPEAVEVSQRALSLNTGLIAYWNFDYGSGTVALDSSGFGHNALIEGGGSHSWPAGKIGANALALAGGRYARVQPTSTLDSPTNAISISGWIYRDTAAVGDEYAVYRRNSSMGSVFHLLQGPSGSVCFSVAGNQLCTSPLSVGAWHHIVATWDGSQKRIYADGVVAAENETISTLSYSSSYSLYIGSNQGGSLSWKGQLDDLRLHGRSLSASDVYELFTQRTPVQYPAGRALLVVGQTTLSASDAALKAKLERMGFEVVVVDDTVSVAADAAGKQLVFLSESCKSEQLLTPTGSGPVTSKFKTVAAPVVVSEVAAWDDLGMTGVNWGTDYGDSSSESQLNVTYTPGRRYSCCGCEHGWAAGLVGTIADGEKLLGELA